MKRKYFFQTFLVVMMPVVILFGCKSGGQRAPETIDEAEAGEIADRIETIKQVYHLCPSPAEMLSVIDVSDLSFNGGLLNPPDNVEKYLDTRSRTLALGIYITDLAYAALFGRHEETLDYLELVQSVAEDIRVTGAINDELIEKARNNVEYLDSLFNISNEAFINMLFYCERNNRPNTIIMLSAGAFIESLYLAVSLVEEYDEASYILQHIADQKYAIDNLMIFGESLSNTDPNIKTVLEDMSTLKGIYDGIESGTGGVSITSQEDAGDQPKKLVIGGGDTAPATLSETEFYKLKEETTRLRAKLIEG